jgi:hypothetical protein
MVTIGSLWMPILASAVIVFIASFLAWVVSPHHKSDWKRLPDEDAVRAAMNKEKLAPGQYLVPYAVDQKAMQDDAYLKKCSEGPVGILTLREPGPPTMGKPIAMSFVYYVFVSTAVAYVTGRTLAPGADYLHVFQIAGTVAMLAYGGAFFQAAIWFGRPWGPTLKEVGDAIVYGLLTAGAFGWLWPH